MDDITKASGLRLRGWLPVVPPPDGDGGPEKTCCPLTEDMQCSIKKGPDSVAVTATRF